MFAALQKSCISAEKEKKHVSFADDCGLPLETTYHYLSYDSASSSENETIEVSDEPFDMDEFVKFLQEESQKTSSRSFTSTVFRCPLFSPNLPGLNPLDAALYSIWTSPSPLQSAPSGFAGFFHNNSTPSHKPLHR